jgi:hypothetical protein
VPLLFVARLEILWTTTRYGPETIDKRIVVLPPMILERNNSSTSFSAVNELLPALRMESLNELSQELGWASMADAPDSCRSNRRLSAFVGDQSGPRLLYSPGGCVSHKLRNIITNTTKEKHLVGNCHALEFVLSITQRRNEILESFWKLLQDPNETDIILGDPDPAWGVINRLVLHHTMLRFEHYVSGSSPVEARLTGSP